MRAFFIRWAVLAVAVLAAAHLIPGIDYDSVPALLAASLFLGIFNAVLKPVLMILTLPILLVSLGLFMFVINAGLLWLVGWLIKGFYVDSFLSAFFGSIVISLVSLVLNSLVWDQGRPRIYRGKDDVIDVKAEKLD